MTFIIKAEAEPSDFRDPRGPLRMPAVPIMLPTMQLTINHCHYRHHLQSYTAGKGTGPAA